MVDITCMGTDKNPALSKKPKVSIIHFSGPPHINGVDLIIRDQARLFRLHGHHVDIYSGSAKTYRKDISIRNNTLIRPKHPLVYKVRQELEKGVVSDDFYKLESRLYRSIKKYLKTSGVGVVVIHNIFTRHYNIALTSALVKLSNEFMDIKFIVWVHDITFYNQPDLKLSQDLALTFPWNLLVTPHPRMRYVTVSDFLRRDLTKAFNKKVEPDKVITIPNTHDVPKFFRLSHHMRDLYDEAGVENSDMIAVIPVRAIHRKRLEFAIDIAKEMTTRGINFKLLLTANEDTKRVENIQYYNSLKKKVIQLGLERQVYFLEEYFKKFDKPGRPKAIIPIPELFIIADLLLLPSNLEGFGMPLIEAGMMRCPIFASDIPPFREIGTTNINYFKLTDTPQEVADLIIRKLKSMSQSYFYHKVIRQYGMKKMFREKVIPLIQ